MKLSIELRGKLEFTSLWYPIKLTTETKEIDLREMLFNLFEELNGKPATFEWSSSIFEIKADPSSKNSVEYMSDNDGISIAFKSDTGAQYLHSILPMVLQDLNARNIIVYATESGIKITEDPLEKVFGVYYTDGNSCKVDERTAHKVCKIKTSDACIFCTLSADGFYCQKFDSFSARQLLNRRIKNQMNATRIGNCTILGRKEKN